MFNTIREKFWSFFRNSGTILKERLEAAIGFVLAVFSSVDWSPLMSMDFSQAFVWNQFTVIGGIMLLKGILGEWIRIRGTKDIAGHLVPTQESLGPDVVIKTKVVK